MSKTKIQWCDETWNPVTGCAKISEGCRNCYAERHAERLKKMGCAKYKDGFNVTCHYDDVQKRFPGGGKRIFVNSMSDLFHGDVSFWFIASVIDNIEAHPGHTFMVLTKRPERALEFFRWRERELGKKHILPNLQMGVTTENQRAAHWRVPVLLRIPAAARFVSVEPMLEEVDFSFCAQFEHEDNEGHGVEVIKGLDWVICGGESGREARPAHPDWVRGLRDQCVSAGVPFFFKQWGEWIEIYDRDKDDPDCRRIPKETPGETRWLNLAGGQGFHGDRVVMVKRTRKKSKSLPELDGKVWAEFPGDVKI